MTLPESIVKRIKSDNAIPMLPHAAYETLQLLDQPNTTAKMLARVIENDQSLASRILRVANSPLYGFPRQISTIEFATVILGFETLRELVLGAALANLFEGGGNDRVIDLWRHASKVAVISRFVAKKVGYRVVSETYIAGLIHDIGILVIAQACPTEFATIFALTQEGIPFAESEKKLLDATHMDVGRWLMEQWNMPAQLVEAAGCHHAPDTAERFPMLVRIVHCAETLAWKFKEVPLNDPFADPPSDEAEALLEAVLFANSSQAPEEVYAELDQELTAIAEALA